MTGFHDHISMRPATSDDFEEIQAVDLAAGKLFDVTGLIDEGPDGQSPIPLHALKKGMKYGLLTVACYDEDKIIGFLLCRKVSPDLYLEQISVRPEFGRRGLGSRLTEYAIQQADDLRLRGVVLSTFRDVAWNGPFYERHGFVELTQNQKKGWMLDLEKLQAQSMDVNLRCFMRRPGKWDGNLLRIPQSEAPAARKRIATAKKT